MFGIAEKKEKLKLVVGVSSGIYMVARTPELSSIVRKLGFALTRGANAIELAGDVPHEVDYTHGKELRYIAEKQDLTLLFHGSLTVPMAMPERGEWRDAQNHIQKSVRSAVMGGCKYVNFHACLNFWLEMMTYAGRKLSLTFCDHKGNFIDTIMKENEQLRNWFVERKWDSYGGDILMPDETVRVQTSIERETDKTRRQTLAKEVIKKVGEPGMQRFLDAYGERRFRGIDDVEMRRELAKNDIVDRILNTGIVSRDYPEDLRKILQGVVDEARKRITEEAAEIRKEAWQEEIEEKLKAGKKWDSEELRAVFGVIDGYHIMAHYLYYKKDPIWETMYEMYKDVLESPRYRSVTYHRNGKIYTYRGPVPEEDGRKVDYWLDAAWEKAERENDRAFKEFYYSVCAAKFVEGHISETLKWMKDEGSEGLIGGLKSEVKDNDEFKKLKKAAEDLKITLEIPDARSPEYGGLYLICRPKQVYAAVKTIREQLDTAKLFMLIDFEHIATQGFDAINEIKDFVKLAPDAGKYILSLHITKPTPLHHHIQVEIGDIEVYKLVWELTKAGLGEHHTTYLIFERGGERDPFKQSVTAIRLMVDQLQQGTKPDELVAKPEFFGVAGPALASEERQRVVIREHARDPIDGLLVVPEEKYTELGKAATAKPGGAEKWKKEELT